MKRLKFMKGLRVEAYLSPKSRPRVKDNAKFVQLFFVVKMTADYALACDRIVQRAFEDCEDHDRKIDKVGLGHADVPCTDVEVYSVSDAKEPMYRLENVTVEGLACERVKGETFLYFSIITPQMRRGLWPWYGQAYNHTLFLEFKPSQFALGTDNEDELSGVASETEEYPAGDR